LTSQSLARGRPITPKNITISRPGICIAAERHADGRLRP